MQIKIFTILVVIVGLVIFSVVPALARTTGGSGGGGTISLPNPIGVESFTELIYRIIDFLAFTIGPAAVTLMILIGAFQILMAGGNPEKVTMGRKTITYAVIGFAILLLADGIIYIIVNILE